MQIGIVSDTHDNLDLVDRAVDFLESEGVARVIHCGDIVAPFSATPFDSDNFEFYAVRGNNDGEWALAETVEEFGTYHGESAALTFDGVDVAVYHGTSEQLVESLVRCGDYDYVVRGHTHERTHEKRGGTTHVNPGGLPFPGADDAYHVATLDTEPGAVTFHEVSP